MAYVCPFGSEEDFQLFLSTYTEDEDEQVQTRELVHTITFDPGTSVDCDDCGYTPDRVVYDEYNDNSYVLEISLGCFGGCYYSSSENIQDSMNYLISLPADVFKGEVVDQIRARLQNLQKITSK